MSCITINLGPKVQVVNIPSVVRVGSCMYSVEYVGELYDKGQDLYGQCRYTTKEIVIHESLANTPEAEFTFLHELVHAIAYEYGDPNLTRDKEDIIELMSKGLRQVVLDNPEIFGGGEVG